MCYFKALPKLRKTFLSFLFLEIYHKAGDCTTLKTDNSVIESYSCHGNERRLLLNKWCLLWICSLHTPIRTYFVFYKTNTTISWWGNTPYKCMKQNTILCGTFLCLFKFMEMTAYCTQQSRILIWIAEPYWVIVQMSLSRMC